MLVILLLMTGLVMLLLCDLITVCGKCKSIFLFPVLFVKYYKYEILVIYCASRIVV